MLFLVETLSVAISFCKTKQVFDSFSINNKDYENKRKINAPTW